MRVEWREWEGLAADLLEQAGCDGEYVDALELAECCGLSVKWRMGRTYIDASTLYVSPRLDGPRLHGAIAHELGHWTLQRAGLDYNDERAANYVGAALLVPRQLVMRALRVRDVSFDKLREAHPNASAELLARRIWDVSRRAVTVWDNGKPRWRKGLMDDARIVEIATETRMPAASAHACAWPVVSGDWVRVVCLET